MRIFATLQMLLSIQLSRCGVIAETLDIFENAYTHYCVPYMECTR